MARRTLDFGTIELTYMGMHRSPLVPLQDVQPDGLLELFNSWARVGRDLSVTARQIHTKITGVKHLRAATLIEVHTGTWGDGTRRLVNHTGVEADRQIDEDDAATAMTRALLIAPPGADIGLYFVEREGNHAGGSRVWSSFDAVIKGSPAVPNPRGDLCHIKATRTGITRGDEWNQAAQLRAVEVKVYSPAVELGDDRDYTVRDIFRRESFTPAKKSRFLPENVKDKLLSTATPAEAAEFLGVEIEGDEDVEAVVVTMNVDGVEKKYEIGTPKSPLIRVQLNDHGSPVVSDAKFIEECDRLARACYEGLGLTYSYAWTR